jgi:hypothetical protein
MTTKSSFLTADVLAACDEYGPQLRVPAPLDGVMTMRAIASNESSTGADCGPRHEPAYDAGGVYGDGAVMRPLLAAYGAAAACSYGPWQMMFCNYSGAYSPSELLVDLQANAVEFVRFFNNNVATRVTSLSDIGQVWNSGHVSTAPSPGVVTYVSRLQAAYDAAQQQQGGS